MRAIIQRVKQASVSVDEKIITQIEQGYLVLLGVGQNDQSSDVKYLAEKIAHLRIFPDEQGKMNLSLLDVGGAALVVSQFTLYGDCRKGRRPSFSSAGAPEQANNLYDEFVKQLANYGIPVSTGVFQADMQVSLVNDGPVTMLLSTEGEF